MNLREAVTKALDDEDQELTPEQLMDFMKEKKKMLRNNKKPKVLLFVLFCYIYTGIYINKR